MNLELSKWALSVVLVGTAAGCSGSNMTDHDESVGSSSTALIGGRAAMPGEYPSSVALLWATDYMRCSMTKVGPRRFLALASCLYDNTSGQLVADFKEGAPMHLSTALTLTGAPTHVLIIVQVTIQPDWVKCAPTCDFSSSYPRERARLDYSVAWGTSRREPPPA